MAITFNQYDVTNRVPGSFIEFDPSRAITGLASVPFRALLFGQFDESVTTTTPNVPIPVGSFGEAKTLFGAGSQLTDMFDYFYLNNSNIETWGMPLSDTGGTAAEKTITVTAATTEGGVIALNVGGRSVRVTVEPSVIDAAITIAASIETAINANPDLLFSTTVAGTNVVTLTAKNGGEWTEEIPLEVNYRNAEIGGSEVLPVGVDLAFATSVAGLVNTDLGDALDAILDEVFNYFVLPFNDDANLLKVATEADLRQAVPDQLEGHWFLLLW